MTQKKDKGRGRFPPQAPGKEVCLEIGETHRQPGSWGDTESKTSIRGFEGACYLAPQFLQMSLPVQEKLVVTGS